MGTMANAVPSRQNAMMAFCQELSQPVLHHGTDIRQSQRTGRTEALQRYRNAEN